MNLNINIDNPNQCQHILGSNNTNLKVLEELYEIEMDFHGSTIITNIDDERIINELDEIFKLLILLSNNKIAISPRDVIYISKIVKENNIDNFIEFIKHRKPIARTYNNKAIYSKTLKQDEYIKLLNTKDLVFAIGSAGTGKTYLAVCYAVNELKNNKYEKIILTRPAVEAGESLGFLPGDLKEKVDPYLRPLYDALYDMLGVTQTNNLIERGVIEIAPLAYMRGRTLENSFIILDEAQNATIDQLKMFLTRLGFNSKMVLTGDITQIDLPSSKKSGLELSSRILNDIPEVGTIIFLSSDVVRHPLVAKIIDKFKLLEK